MGWFDFLRGATQDGDARRRAQEAHAARVRKEIARIERGESPTGLFGGPPTREAQEFERRFRQEEAERRDHADVQAVRRGALRDVPDAHLGPRARDERFYHERDTREAARRQADEQHRREEERRWREAQEVQRREREARWREDERRRDEELRERRDREWREQEARDRRDREERERRDREERDRRDREDRERREREHRDRGGRW